MTFCTQCEDRTSFLIDLNCSSIGFDSNDFSREFIVTYIDLKIISIMAHWKRGEPLYTSSYMATPIMFSAMTTGLRIRQ